MADNITGRDAYIIAKALAYAVEAIEALPPDRREWSDQSDMKILLDHMVQGEEQLAGLIANVRRHLRGEDREG